jgi:hypothetical protein
MIGSYGGCFEEDGGLCVGEQAKVLPRDLDLSAKYTSCLEVRVGKSSGSA